LGGKVYPFDDNKTRGGGGELVQTIFFIKNGLKLPYFKECFGISIFIPQVIACHQCRYNGVFKKLLNYL
jgi:hypothetical protein